MGFLDGNDCMGVSAALGSLAEPSACSYPQRPACVVLPGVVLLIEVSWDDVLEH